MKLLKKIANSTALPAIAAVLAGLISITVIQKPANFVIYLAVAAWLGYSAYRRYSQPDATRNIGVSAVSFLIIGLVLLGLIGGLLLVFTQSAG